MAERVVVDPRQMPHEVRDEPERQRDVPAGCATTRRATASRRDGEYEQRRRPLGEHDVLQQVRPQERVRRERLQLGREGGEDESERGGSACDSPASGGLGARDQRVAEREQRDEDDGLQREHAWRYASSSPCGRSSMVEHARFPTLSTRVRFPSPASPSGVLAMLSVMKTDEQRRARELRAEGWSVKEIQQHLGVSRSSVSIWVRDVPLDRQQRVDARGKAPARSDRRR